MHQNLTTVSDVNWTKNSNGECVAETTTWPKYTIIVQPITILRLQNITKSRIYSLMPSPAVNMQVLRLILSL